jgi:N-acyl-D-amino-acid deacylase
MADYDIQIKGGTIIDGTRVPRYRGDVWIRDGRIAQLGGRAPGFAKKVIDADGLIVAPGFVDLHTHYDAQIRWDPYCTISGWHGVTSVVLGNCGFGFAPVKPDFRERSMLTMTRTEAIPYESMKVGLPWDWETIPEYLDSLDRAPKGVNCIQYMPTASLMTYVMGLEAAKTRPATEEERAEMRRLLHQGLEAGLCGFSIQRLGRNSNQADYDGSPMVTDTMCDEDIFNLARVLRERDEGFIEITQATGYIKDDLAFVEKLAEQARRPVLHNAIVATRKNPTVHQKSLRWLEKMREKGLPIFGQSGVGGRIPDLIVQWVNDQPELEKYVGKSIGQIAQEENKHPTDVMLDLAVATDLKAEFLGPNKGFNAEFTAEMINNSRFTFPGVSDGGAHTKFFCGGAFTTDFLCWLVRDEQKVTLEEAHFRLSALPAHAAGFRDRGVLREGAWADVVVYDLNGLGIEPDWIGEISHDFPGGEWRRVQHAQGYRAIIVNGQMTFDEGKATGATPGKLLRHGRA